MGGRRLSFSISVICYEKQQNSPKEREENIF
jgi:hypothetical protein